MDTVRQKLMSSYQGLLDPSRSPHVIMDGLPVLRIYDYEGVVAALTRPEFTHQILPSFIPTEWLNPILSGPVIQPLGEWHDKLRKAFVDIVSADAIRGLNQFIASRANDFVEAAVRRNEPFDLARITDRITYEVICELLGVEDIKSDAQRRNFFGWMDELTAVTSPLKLPRQREVWAFYDGYAKARLKMGQAKPIDRLLRSEVFTHANKVALLYFIMTSATITTSYTICAAWTLLKTMDDKNVFEEIKSNAVQGSGNLLTHAYQEALRFATPSRCRVILVKRPVKLSGRKLLPGRMVDICFSSANRDARFTNPDLYDPKRPPKPRHIGFGTGEYECPGSGLSGVVSRAMLAALFRFAPNWRIADVVPGGKLILRMNKLVLTPVR